MSLLTKRLLGLKAGQLKQLAFLMGIPSTGTKAELEVMLQARLQSPSALGHDERIVSVDMGIKNLGICVLQRSPPPIPLSTRSPTTTRTSKPTIKILEWKKLDILSRLLDSQSHSHPNPETKPKPNPLIFTPSTLSPLAITLAKDLSTHHTPSYILIERQRFRSGGASAVQEWTLRVNMLEAMLWAALGTMRQSRHLEGGQFPQTHEVSPARVASFWCGVPPGGIGMGGREVSGDLFGDESSSSSSGSAGRQQRRRGDETAKEGSEGIEGGKKKTKIEKKEKIALVRSWLNGEATPGNVSLEFTPAAQEVADGFVSKKGSGKLDDLADCLLQGVAWIRWRENEERISQLLLRDEEEEQG